MAYDKSKTVTILGASSDIGILVTKNFLDIGYKVNAHYNNNCRNLKKIKSTNLKLFKFNLKNIFSWEKYVKKNFFLKKTDILISLTGYLKTSNFKRSNLVEFYNHLNVNFFSSIVLIQNIIPHMIRNKFGRIIFSSSIGTKFGGGEKTYQYSLSKFCNEFFPSELKKLSKINILANTIQIGLTDTKIHKKVKGKNLKKRIKLIPSKRMAEPVEVAEVINDLVSNNKLISSQLINISGGE